MPVLVCIILVPVYEIRADIRLRLEARSLASLFKIEVYWVKALSGFMWRVSMNPKYDVRTMVDCTGVVAHDHYTM
jgi:hypothetical protein